MKAGIINIVIQLLTWHLMLGQPDVDWVNTELETKQQALSHRRALAKEMPVATRSDYDVGYYGLNLRPDIPAGELRGSVTIRGKARIPQLSRINLDLLKNMVVDSVTGDADSMHRSGDLVVLHFSDELDSAETFETVIYYHGVPQKGGFQGFAFDWYEGVPVVSSLSEPYYARSWFPCKDVPKDKADSADIRITVPDTLVAVSNGSLVAEILHADGTKTYHWKETYPIAVYLISVAISDYSCHTDYYYGVAGLTMPVQHWYYPNRKPDDVLFDLTIQMIAFFADIWGEYPFIKEKYGHAQFQWSGGMEHQTCTSLGGYSEYLICHELAHQWWGDMITCASWRDIWLNEGFARYAEALWHEHKYGAAGLQEYMELLNRPEYWNYSPLYLADTSSVGVIFNRLVYDKGAWILHMLRKLMGEEAFWQMYRDYREAYYMDVATTADFQRVCESAAGQQLDWFFDQWVYSLGQPHYRISWTRERIRVNRWKVCLNISQEQETPPVFVMPLEVSFLFDDGATTVTVWDSLQVQEFESEFEQMPVEIVIDPDNWVLKRVTHSQIDPDLGYVPREYLLENPYPNPFNTALNIAYFLPRSSEIQLAVFDLKGRQVDVLVEGRIERGYYTSAWQPYNLPSGIYLLRLKCDDFNRSRKVLFLK